MMKMVTLSLLLFIVCISNIVNGTKLFASTSLLTNENVNITIDSDTSIVTIVYSGPTTAWHSIGFGSTRMSNTYAIIIDGDGSVQERKLASRAAGTALTSSFLSSSSTTSGSIVTTTLTRSITGSSSSYYTFSTTSTSISIIYASGSSATFGTAVHSSDASKTLTFTSVSSTPGVPTSSPTLSPTLEVSLMPLPTSSGIMTTYNNIYLYFTIYFGIILFMFAL